MPLHTDVLGMHTLPVPGLAHRISSELQLAAIFSNKTVSPFGEEGNIESYRKIMGSHHFDLGNRCREYRHKFEYRHTHVAYLNPSHKNDFGTHIRPLLAFKHRTSPELQLIAEVLHETMVSDGSKKVIMFSLTAILRVFVDAISTIPSRNRGISFITGTKMILPNTVAH